MDDAPTLFDRCFGFLMEHEVGANPLDASAWSGAAVGDGTFLAADDGLDMSEGDKGNWTGGAVGAGVLGGTRWGISTAAYHDALALVPGAERVGFPALVKDLTLSQAKTLCMFAYWKRVRCDVLPGPVALVTLDAAFNAGVGAGARWLQAAVGAAPDGAVGALTLAAVARASATDCGTAVAAEALARRIDAMARMPGWATDGLGWSRRLAKLGFQAASLSRP